ncbi:MAG: sn-glycerol-3-phosphate ABC transporter ATP-binding protein UgpC [bacterium]
MAKVVLENVSKVYPGGVTAVATLDLDIHDGEFVVLVGPSGCGKSTTLRMVAGLETASTGTISIGERVVNDVEPKDRNVAMVFQSYALYPHMSVRDNLAFGLKMRKVPRQQIQTKVSDIAQVLGIAELLDRKPKALSGGQRQRVALGRAIVRDPDVFLFDEPLSNLDAKMRVQMRTEISRLHHHLGATMIYVTHDQTEAMTLGQRIVIMHEGKVQQVDSPLELYERPTNRFVAGFIGSPAMNFLSGRLIRENGLWFVLDGATEATAVADSQARIPLPGQFTPAATLLDRPLVLGIRPEHVTVLPLAATVGAPGQVATTGGQGFPASVQVIEPLGNETLLYLSVAGGQFVVRDLGQSAAVVDAVIQLSFQANHIHLFAAEDGRNLRD